jgi:hypothetical protein
MRLLRVLSGLLISLTATSFVTTQADARKKDHANSGYCKSGVQVKDMAKCKENGGKK